MDDIIIIIIGVSPSLIRDLRIYLDYVFKLKDLGSLSYFLGLESA